MDNAERIDRFLKMAEADPDNELGHFSLGKALLEDKQVEKAIPSLQRTLDVNPSFSKAYQVLAEAQIELDQKGQAVETLRKGVAVADERGDLMPRDAMATMLSDLGETPPSFKSKPQPEAIDAASADLICSRCGKPSPKMENQPFKGELGIRVHGAVCHDCWREWVSMGTKVINEMGLALASPEAQVIYDEHMVEFLQMDR